MYGRAIPRQFFFDQALSFKAEHDSKLEGIDPPEPEEEEADFQTLYKTFGAFATIVSIGKQMHMNPLEYLKWSVREFYHLSLFLSWESCYQRRYQKIMMRSQDSK